MSTVLGVDPGQRGAAVVINRHRGLCASAVWRERTRQKRRLFEVEILRAGVVDVLWAKAPWQIGQILLKAFGREDIIEPGKLWHLWTEDAFVGVNAGTSLGGATRAGALQAALESRAVNYEGNWVGPSDWRRAVLNANPFTPREEAKAASLKWIPTLEIPGMAEAVARWPEADHLTDAMGITVHGLIECGDLKGAPQAKRARHDRLVAIEPEPIRLLRASWQGLR